MLLVSVLWLAGTSEATAAVAWTDWTVASTDPSEVSGTLTVGSSQIGITYGGPYLFAQTSGGTNYWNPPSPYISASVDNAPPASDIIALSTGGTKTITFSAPVQDPLLALVSWNSNTVDFGVLIDILSYGNGYWGDGIPVLNSTGTGFYGYGEVHGVVRLPGTFDSITFTDTSESWHGFTVGVSGLAPAPVPEPTTLAIWSALGGLGMIAARRRRRTA